MKHVLPFILCLLAFASQAQVTDLADMSTGRYGHEMIQLPSGDVLAAGGYTGELYTANSEVFDGETWSDVDPMTYPRFSFNLVVAGGQAIAIGGWDGDATNHATTELFNADFGIWEDGPTLTNGRSNCRSIVLNDGRILVTGGYNGTDDLASCELIDPSDWTASTTGDLNFARSSHTLVLLQDGRVMAIGGFNPTYDFQMDECEIYDPSTGEWAVVSPLSTGRDNLTAVVRPDGQVVCMGGRFYDGANNWFAGQTEVEIFDPSTETWASAEPLMHGASYCQAYWRADADDCFLISGTDISGSGVTLTYSDNQQNNFGPDDWFVDAANLTTGRYRQASCMLASGGILVSGGIEDATVQLIGLFDGVDTVAATALQPFPNPATNQITCPGTTAGNTIWTALNGQQVEVSHLGQARWDTSTLPTGIYVVKWTVNEQPVYRRVSVR